MNKLFTTAATATKTIQIIIIIIITIQDIYSLIYFYNNLKYKERKIFKTDKIFDVDMASSDICMKYNID